jgi:cyclase
VIINSAVYENKKLIEDIANVFGSQAVVVSIDAKKNYAKNKYQLFSNCGRELEEVDLEEHVSSCIDHGAGEIFINSIDNDGVMNGFDLDLISRVVACSKIPVIGCGGAGNSEHILKCFTETGVGAIACGSLFNFGDNNPIRVKAFLSNYNIPLKVI